MTVHSIDAIKFPEVLEVNTIHERYIHVWREQKSNISENIYFGKVVIWFLLYCSLAFKYLEIIFILGGDSRAGQGMYFVHFVISVTQVTCCRT